MSNVVPFPPRTTGPQTSGRHLAARLLERPPANSHAVQFYDDHGFLVDTVALFIQHGLGAGQPVLAIATAEHTDGVIERLGRATVASALADKRLVLADADALLARFVVAGEVSPPAFASALDLVLRDLPAVLAGSPFRAFGEMVDRLWQRGQSSAAIQLEEAWCTLCHEREIALLCGYAMSNFYKQDESQRFHAVCRLHSHVLPTEKFARHAGSDFDRLREISLLEQRERLLQGEVFYREQLERTLRDLELRGAQACASSASTERTLVASEHGSCALQAAARDLLEPAAEIRAIARELSSRYSQPAVSDELGRLNAALERLQLAMARLHSDAGEPAPRDADLGATVSRNDHPR